MEQFASGAGEVYPTRTPTNTLIKPLLEYIPRSLNGSTIITSRSREIASKMVDHKGIVEVEPMEISEAVQLLQNRHDSPEDGLGS